MNYILSRLENKDNRHKNIADEKVLHVSFNKYDNKKINKYKTVYQHTTDNKKMFQKK